MAKKHLYAGSFTLCGLEIMGQLRLVKKNSNCGSCNQRKK